MKGDQIQVTSDRGIMFTVVEDNESHCSFCGETILWCVTKKGKKMPVDIPNEIGDSTVSHFATCPNAGERRKP